MTSAPAVDCHFQVKTVSGPVYVVEVLLHLSKDSVKSRNSSLIKPCAPGERGEMQVNMRVL